MMKWLERRHEHMKKIVEVNYRIYSEAKRLLEDEIECSADGTVSQNIINIERAAEWNYNVSAEHLREIESQIEYSKGVNQ